VSSSIRYTDPVRAATGFAVAYVGFTHPIAGAFRAGDSRSGEVPIQSRRGGPVTTVLLRKLAPDDTWFVIGATTPDLQLQEPTSNAVVRSPVTLSGQSTAFEAAVNVTIRQDDSATPLTTDIVMGGSNGQMGPFSKAVPFPKPTAPYGAVVLKTLSAMDGSVSEATVVRVRFG
jgi:hypothetical protein